MGQEMAALQVVRSWLDPGWESRVTSKLCMTALVTVGACVTLARRKHVPVSATDLTTRLLVYGSGVTLLCVFQEGLRAVRGTHDVLNTALASALAGGLTMRTVKGPQYTRVSALAWGLVGTSVHLLHAGLSPLVEAWLINDGLLHPAAAARRTTHAQRPASTEQLYRSAVPASTSAPGSSSSSSSHSEAGGGVPEDLMMEAARIRHRELAHLQGRSLHPQHPGSHPGPTPADSLSQPAAQGLGPADAATQSEEASAVSTAAGGEGGAARRWRWWGWFRRGHTSEPHSSNSRSPGSSGQHDSDSHGSSSLQDLFGDDVLEEEVDEEDFQRWLAARGTNSEGLVLPFK